MWALECVGVAPLCFENTATSSILAIVRRPRPHLHGRLRRYFFFFYFFFLDGDPGSATRTAA